MILQLPQLLLDINLHNGVQLPTGAFHTSSLPSLLAEAAILSLEFRDQHMWLMSMPCHTTHIIGSSFQLLHFPLHLASRGQVFQSRSVFVPSFPPLSPSLSLQFSPTNPYTTLSIPYLQLQMELSHDLLSTHSMALTSFTLMANQHMTELGMPLNTVTTLDNAPCLLAVAFLP